MSSPFAVCRYYFIKKNCYAVLVFVYVQCVLAELLQQWSVTIPLSSIAKYANIEIICVYPRQINAKYEEMGPRHEYNGKRTAYREDNLMELRAHQWIVYFFPFSYFSTLFVHTNTHWLNKNCRENQENGNKTRTGTVNCLRSKFELNISSCEYEFFGLTTILNSNRMFVCVL